MDAHVHLNYIIGEGWETEPVRFTAGDFALRAMPHAQKTLLAGFTTVRDLGTGLGFSDVALMRAIDKGWVVGPRMIPAGHALSITRRPLRPVHGPRAGRRAAGIHLGHRRRRRTKC